jgi:hypothetical protein
MPRKIWQLRFILLLVSTGLGLLLCEIGVRMFFPYFRPSTQIVFHRDADGVPLGSPGERVRVSTPKGDWDITVTFNHYGLRDPKDLAQAQPGDLFVVGDSFTFGWGLEDGLRFSDLLAGKLGRPVYNIAIPGDLRDYATLVHYAERHGAKIENLVVGVCMENDLMDYRARTGPAPPATRVRWREWMKTHSALYLGASHILQAKLGAGGLLQKVGLARGIEQLTAQNVFSEEILTSSRDELLKVVAGRHAVVLLIPSRGLWAGSNMETEKRVHERFAALLAEAGVTVVDMRPRFELSGTPLQYYFTTDPHWNASGHEAAAMALMKPVADMLSSAPR